jgi:hypothetical protein
MKHSSPAYAALEDSAQTFSDADQHIPTQEIASLTTGQFRLRANIMPHGSQRMALKPLVIRQNFQARAPLQADNGLRTETPHGLLPLEERKRILAQYFRAQDYSTLSVRERANELIKQELAVAPANSDVRYVTTALSSNPIIVAKPNADISGLLRGTPRPLMEATRGGDRPEPPMTVASNNSMASAFRTSSDEHAPTLSVSSLAGPNKNPHVLRGQLQVRNGLAFMGAETYFTLRRYDEGNLFENGRVWVSEARFEIYVREPRGQLVAELHGHDGVILGRGRLDLDDTASATDQLKIELSPITTGASVRVTSAYSEGRNHVAVKNALVAFENGIPQPLNEDGLRVDPDRSHASTFMVRAHADKHWPTLAMGVEGQVKEVRIYPESMMKSLLDLSLKSDKRGTAEQNGVVWGRILKDGKPVTGVEVELAGQYSPVYFNQIYIPDNKLTATDGNGMFAFLLVRPGVQAIRVRYKGKVYPAQVFPTEERHLSYVEINLEGNQSVNVALQDAFDPNHKVSAHVRFVGVDDEVGIEGSQKLHYPSGPDIMTLEADAGTEYELSRVQVLKTDSRVIVPMVKRSWLQSIIDMKQIELIPRRGTLLGFVADQPFQVELTGYTTDGPQIVYFDAQGLLVSGTSAPAGGGFVLFNAPLGLQTVTIKPIASNQTFTQTFVAEPEFLHIFKYSFGGSY